MSCPKQRLTQLSCPEISRSQHPSRLCCVCGAPRPSAACVALNTTPSTSPASAISCSCASAMADIPAAPAADLASALRSAPGLMAFTTRSAPSCRARSAASICRKSATSSAKRPASVSPLAPRSRSCCSFANASSLKAIWNDRRCQSDCTMTLRKQLYSPARFISPDPASGWPPSGGNSLAATPGPEVDAIVPSAKPPPPA
mmetsp:Transcript_24259/g.79110  ORF Transcript_24259/g.79110 Transcript_24259/m.79110 type:complete len:201 (-) Transcript_24259:34-636(-)